MSERITNAETIRILDLGLQLPPSVAEAAYRKLYELENKYAMYAERCNAAGESVESPKKTNKRKEN